MLSEWEESVLKYNRIDPDTVESVSNSMEVTFKNGDKRTICEIWSRCMGYLRRTVDFNVGKRSEYDDRKMFTEDKCKCHLEDND